jgi:hypothetical protein
MVQRAGDIGTNGEGSDISVHRQVHTGQSLEVADGLWRLFLRDALKHLRFQGPFLLQKLTLNNLYLLYDLLGALEEAQMNVPHLVFKTRLEDYHMKYPYVSLFGSARTLEVFAISPSVMPLFHNVSTLCVQRVKLEDVARYMPHIRTLKVESELIFDSTACTDIPNLQYLHVGRVKGCSDHEPVALPHLISLTVEQGPFWGLSSLHVCSLERLCIGEPDSWGNSKTSRIREALRGHREALSRVLTADQFQLFPSTIYLYLSLTPDLLASFLAKSNSLKHLFVHVDPTDMEAFTGCFTSQHKGKEGERKLCQGLMTLTMFLAGNQAATSRWIEVACRILRGRSGPATTLESVSYEWEWGQKITVTMEEAINRRDAKQEEKSLLYL